MSAIRLLDRFCGAILALAVSVILAVTFAPVWGAVAELAAHGLH